MIYEEGFKKVQEFNQEHILKYYPILKDQEKNFLLNQIKETDFSVLKQINSNIDEDKVEIEPIDVHRIKEDSEKENKCLKVGIEKLKEKKVAAILLAGGMGTRLGADKAKGMYDIGVNKELYIFQCLINNLLDVVKVVGEYIPFFIMTSDKNHEDTIIFLQEKEYFSYPKEFIYFFKQDMAPTTDFNGKIYLEEKWKMSTSPNGSAGWYSSLKNTPLFSKIEEMQIEWFNVFSVDNVLQKIADPYFIGATIEGEYDMGAKVVKKVTPDEKVGVICLKNNKPAIIEYYEASKEMRSQCDEQGELVYSAGVILNYLFRKDILDLVTRKTLPVHVVEKKIPYLNEQAEKIKPSVPNGYKYEQLVFDLVSYTNSCLVLEVNREKEFAPIKNSTGIDSVESARELLKKNGIEI